MKKKSKDIAVNALRADAKTLHEIESLFLQAYYDRHDITITIGGKTFTLEPMLSGEISNGIHDVREKNENQARIIEYANTLDPIKQMKFYAGLPPFIVKNHFYPPEETNE